MEKLQKDIQTEAETEEYLKEAMTWFAPSEPTFSLAVDHRTGARIAW